MNPIELLERLASRGISVVVVGGIALRIYDSPRVTQDLDLAARTLDIDAIIDTMYEEGYALVIAVNEEKVSLAGDAPTAESWIELNRPGSMSYVTRPSYYIGDEIFITDHGDLDVLSQVDFLIDLAVPYARLRDNARTFYAGNTKLLVASPEDLIALKKARSDRSAADDADIDYLNRLLERERTEE